MNRDILSKIAVFAAGAAVGSVITWKLVKTKYEQIAQEEIDSVREAYSNRDQEVEHTEEEDPEESEEEELENLIKEEQYATETNEEQEEVEEDMDVSKPYVISPEEFGDSDYATVTLWYYTDGVVANDRLKMIDNVKELLGEDFASHFGDYDYDPDTVYVRNDEQEIDYEVLKDYREFSEVS